MYDTDNHLFACNFAKYSPIIPFFFNSRLSNKPFLIWLLTTWPHHTLNMLLHDLVNRFLTLIFHKVVWQHMQGLMGLLAIILLQIY